MRLTRAGIDLNALRHNFQIVRKRVGSNVKVMGVVKANAYGHGALEVARALISAGCEYLGVAFPEEGIALRTGGITAPILVLTGILPDQIPAILANDLLPTVTTTEVAGYLDREAARSGRPPVRVHCKVDSGMGRQGQRVEEALPFVAGACRMKHLAVEGIYSHFANSEETASPFAKEQLELFMTFVRKLEKEGIEIPLRHIANSGGIINMPESHCTLVRPGIMLYGYAPARTSPESETLRPVLSLTSAVTFLKEVPAGTSISYGRTWFTKTETIIATVPIGYADGYSRRLSNRSHVIIRGRRCPVVGTVCMDQLMVDAGANAAVQIGDEVTLIGSAGGETVTAWDLADQAGTIPYEILTGIGERVPRVYHHEG
jgi:alanine racemase